MVPLPASSPAVRLRTNQSSSRYNPDIEIIICYCALSFPVSVPIRHRQFDENQKVIAGRSDAVRRRVVRGWDAFDTTRHGLCHYLREIKMKILHVGKVSTLFMWLPLIGELEGNRESRGTWLLFVQLSSRLVSCCTSFPDFAEASVIVSVPAAMLLESKGARWASPIVANGLRTGGVSRCRGDSGTSHCCICPSTPSRKSLTR